MWDHFILLNHQTGKNSKRNYLKQTQPPDSKVLIFYFSVETPKDKHL